MFRNAVGLCGAVIAALVLAAQASAAPTFAPAVHLPGTAGRTESRESFGPTGFGSVITNLDSDGSAAVFGSSDGGFTWQKTAAEPAGQNSATTDVDIVTLTAGKH